MKEESLTCPVHIGVLVSLARPIPLQARGRVWGNACIEFVRAAIVLVNDVLKYYMILLIIIFHNVKIARVLTCYSILLFNIFPSRVNRHHA